MPAVSLLPGTNIGAGVGDWLEVHNGERADEAEGNALPALETPDDWDVELLGIPVRCMSAEDASFLRGNAA